MESHPEISIFQKREWVQHEFEGIFRRFPSKSGIAFEEKDQKLVIKSGFRFSVRAPEPDKQKHRFFGVWAQKPCLDFEGKVQIVPTRAQKI